MKSNTDLSFAELYAVERAARSARAREVARLIHAGMAALVRAAKGVSRPTAGKDVCHA